MSGPEMVWLGRTEEPQDESAFTADAIGAKASGVWRMGRLGLETPPAFALPSALCPEVNAGSAGATERVGQGLLAGLERLERSTGRRLGDPREPLLVSVRSGAAKSMPGMMSTVLNVGLNVGAVHGLIRLSGDPRFAWDSYRRFLEGYATIVLGAPTRPFAERLAAMIGEESAADESELDGEALERLAADFETLVVHLTGHAIPDHPADQLTQAALAVFRSWEAPKARSYRELNGLQDLTGAAVTVQAMVFGNGGARSGAGVAFSRDPSTGEKALYLDFLFDAQGEDVVSGRRTPLDARRFATVLPDVFGELSRGAALLEADRRDVQDIEFTVQNGELYFLQTRSAQRTPRALLRTTVDLVREGVIDCATGLRRLEGTDLRHAGTTRFADQVEPTACGISASPGVASGRVAFDSAEAKSLAATGESVILVRPEPATEDIEGFAASSGILTAAGGRTAHAAVVARHLGKACIVGCGDLAMAEGMTSARLAGRPLRRGDWLSLDGGRGAVTLGRREIVTEPPTAELAEVARWRDSLESSLATEA